MHQLRFRTRMLSEDIRILKWAAVREAPMAAAREAPMAAAREAPMAAAREAQMVVAREAQMVVARKDHGRPEGRAEEGGAEVIFAKQEMEATTEAGTGVTISKMVTETVVATQVSESSKDSTATTEPRPAYKSQRRRRVYLCSV